MPDLHVSRDSKLRMAVIGCGPIGNLHAQAIGSSPLATLVAVCDSDSQRCQAAATRFAAKPYASVGELLAGERLDAVTIATPDHLHVEPALAAIAKGCHVFCEKPLAATVDEAQRMADAALERGVQLAVDYNRRFAFGYRTARRLLDEGRIGKLDYALIRVTDPVPRAEVARHPQVIFTTLLTHHLDLMRVYGGEIRRIQAHAGGMATGALLRNVTVSLQFGGGAMGTIVAGYRDGQTRTAEWLELGGTAGSIVVEDVTRRVILSGTAPDRSESFEPNPFGGGQAFYDSLVEHVQVFIEHVARGVAPPVTARDGLIGMQLAAAAIESLARGTAIEV